MQISRILMFLSMFAFFTQCTSAQQKGGKKKSGNSAINRGQRSATDVSQEEIAAIIKNSEDPYQNATKGNTYGIWGHGPLNDKTGSYLKKLSFLRGWNITFSWRDLEPQKGQFDWNYFDSQIRQVVESNLSVGFMVWVGHNSPEWLYNEGVPKVTTDNRKGVEYYPYYLNKYYTDRYLNMLKNVALHIESLPTAARKKIVFWMSAEGTTGDISPYKGNPSDQRYDISDEKWFEYKKEAWLAMNAYAQQHCPGVNILINQGAGGEYFDWLVKNMPNVWMKVSGLTDDYNSAGEYTYYKRVQRAVNHTMKDSTANRFRAECEDVHYNSWYQEAPQWNTYALIGSCLHNGLDIFNIRPQSFIGNTKDLSPLFFFNQYAGQKNPATAKGAFCMLRDVLDVSDTKRFPESQYGKVLTLSKADLDKMESRAAGLPDELQKSMRVRIYAQNVSEKRVKAILDAYKPYGAAADDLDMISNGTSTDFTNRSARQQAQKMTDQQRQQSKGNIDNSSTDKLTNDMGFDLIPDNYYQYLTQYDPNGTSRGYWRIGPKDQIYGRFARGFDQAKGMKEMFFALDKNFFNGSTAAQRVQVKVTYYDGGNGEWALNYYDGSNRKKAYTVKCTGADTWVTKTVTLSDIQFTGKLENNCDLSLQYLGGENTIFSTIEVLR